MCTACIGEQYRRLSNVLMVKNMLGNSIVCFDSFFLEATGSVNKVFLLCEKDLKS